LSAAFEEHFANYCQSEKDHAQKYWYKWITNLHLVMLQFFYTSLLDSWTMEIL